MRAPFLGSESDPQKPNKRLLTQPCVNKLLLGFWVPENVPKTGTAIATDFGSNFRVR